ncbi:MAG TPA: enoyl-CoA hydratase/isomerase family protein [Microthrixaceae bacterium]|nr:enoyl-CoA hydratase/isomerase family protein [Microthrixaceae bacterium]
MTVNDSDGVRTITWTRPDALNALSIDMWNGTRDALRSADADGVKVIVITGEGRAFTVGQDLGEFADPRHGEEGSGFRGLMSALAEVPVPLIAAVNGMAVGFGLTLLPWCDIAFVAESARFKAPFVSLGVVTEAAASVSLAALVGPQRAAEMVLSGEWFSSQWAVDNGLALRRVPDEELAEVAASWAQQLSQQPPDALRTTTALMRQGVRVGWSEAVQREYDEMARLAGGPENIAAITKFFDRS